MISQLKLRIQNLKNQPTNDSFKDAIKWLGLDRVSIGHLRVKLNQSID